jgi:AcrR family transcriptional regulator
VNAKSPTGHLRNSPRQARSAARVEVLLDAAAEVFEEVGFDAATTNLVASRADVPVGTLYRWFPDKAALAEALTDRYLEVLGALYRDMASQIAPQERIGEFLHRSLQSLALAARAQRALPALLTSAMVPGRRSSAGERLREGLLAQVRTLIELRIPGVPVDIRDETAEVCVTLTHLVIASAADDDDLRRDRMMSEYIDVLLAYLEAKFPSPGSPAWEDPNVAVRPRFPAPNSAARLAALIDTPR